MRLKGCTTPARYSDMPEKMEEMLCSLEAMTSNLNMESQLELRDHTWRIRDRVDFLALEFSGVNTVLRFTHKLRKVTTT